MKIPCVAITPLLRVLEARQVTRSELAIMYNERYGGKDGTSAVGKLLNLPMIPVSSADRLAILLDTHPILVWGADEWDNPTLIEGGIATISREKHKRERSDEDNETVPLADSRTRTVRR
jgi:hypothetical protein